MVFQELFFFANSHTFANLSRSRAIYLQTRQIFHRSKVDFPCHVSFQGGNIYLHLQIKRNPKEYLQLAMALDDRNCFAPLGLWSIRGILGTQEAMLLGEECYGWSTNPS